MEKIPWNRYLFGMTKEQQRPYKKHFDLASEAFWNAYDRIITANEAGRVVHNAGKELGAVQANLLDAYEEYEQVWRRNGTSEEAIATLREFYTGQVEALAKRAMSEALLPPVPLKKARPKAPVGVGRLVVPALLIAAGAAVETTNYPTDNQNNDAQIATTVVRRPVPRDLVAPALPELPQENVVDLSEVAIAPANLPTEEASIITHERPLPQPQVAQAPMNESPQGEGGPLTTTPPSDEATTP